MIRNTDLHRMESMDHFPPKCVCATKDKARKQWKTRHNLCGLHSQQQQQQQQNKVRISYDAYRWTMHDVLSTFIP